MIESVDGLFDTRVEWTLALKRECGASASQASLTICDPTIFF